MANSYHFFGVIGVFREPITPTPHFHHPTTHKYELLFMFFVHLFLTFECYRYSSRNKIDGLVSIPAPEFPILAALVP